MFTLFDESYDLVGRSGSCVNHHVRWINGHYFELVTGQSGLKKIRARLSHMVLRERQRHDEVLGLYVVEQDNPF